MMLDSLDVLSLDVIIQLEQRKETGQSLVTSLDSLRDLTPTLGQHQPSLVFLVIDETKLAKLFDHVGHRGLADVQRIGDVDDACLARLLDQFQDAFQIIFRSQPNRPISDNGL